MNSEHRPYIKFTGKSRLQKSINSLLGMVDGIAADKVINASEIDFLKMWLDDHQDVQGLHPFNELVPVVKDAVADGVLTQDERDDIVWLCGKLCSEEYYDKVTSNLQRLHAIVGGIAADGVITEDELRGLSDWLMEHDYLKTCWPYDEIDSLVTAVMTDHRIDPDEHKMLMGFFTEFINILDERTISNPCIAENGTIHGLCAVCPDIKFNGSRFCFTGASSRYTRAELVDVVTKMGGEFLPSVSAKVNYLVIGADGNPCWAYACYGRKVEKAVELRKSGVRLQLIHENDFHDAIADLR
jgi:hypothetical protein